jgi:hypothetical protein
MSSGGGSAPTGQTITQTDIPEYAKPYFERLLQRAESQSLQGYQAFPGQRQASLPPDVAAAYDVTRRTAGQGIAGLPQAMGVAAGNVQAGQQIARQAQPFQFGASGFSQFQPSQFAGFEAQQATPFQQFQQAQFTAGQASPFAQFEAAGADQFQFDPTQRFTGANVQEYMSMSSLAVQFSSSTSSVALVRLKRLALGLSEDRVRQFRSRSQSAT